MDDQIFSDDVVFGYGTVTTFEKLMLDDDYINCNFMFIDDKIYKREKVEKVYKLIFERSSNEELKKYLIDLDLFDKPIVTDIYAVMFFVNMVVSLQF